MVKGSFAADGIAATLDGKLFTFVDVGGESRGCTAMEVVVRQGSGERKGFATTKGDDNEVEELKKTELSFVISQSFSAS